MGRTTAALMDDEGTPDTLRLLGLLADARLDYVIIGGVAASIWGSLIYTDDLDIALRFDAAQVEGLLAALRPHHPKHATRTDLGEIRDPIDYLVTFRMLLIETDLGRIDALNEVAPIGRYERLAARATEFEIDGRMHRVIDIDDLIAVKEMVARPKDIQVALELRAIRAQRERR